jgi:hypothetical protein
VVKFPVKKTKKSSKTAPCWVQDEKMTPIAFNPDDPVLFPKTIGRDKMTALLKTEPVWTIPAVVSGRETRARARGP